MQQINRSTSLYNFLNKKKQATTEAQIAELEIIILDDIGEDISDYCLVTLLSLNS